MKKIFAVVVGVCSLVATYAWAGGGDADLSGKESRKAALSLQLEREVQRIDVTISNLSDKDQDDVRCSIAVDSDGNYDAGVRRLPVGSYQANANAYDADGNQILAGSGFFSVNYGEVAKVTIPLGLGDGIAIEFTINDLPGQYKEGEYYTVIAGGYEVMARFFDGALHFSHWMGWDESSLDWSVVDKNGDTWLGRVPYVDPTHGLTLSMGFWGRGGGQVDLAIKFAAPNVSVTAESGDMADSANIYVCNGESTDLVVTGLDFQTSTTLTRFCADNICSTPRSDAHGFYGVSMSTDFYVAASKCKTIKVVSVAPAGVEYSVFLVGGQVEIAGESKSLPTDGSIWFSSKY